MDEADFFEDGDEEGGEDGDDDGDGDYGDDGDDRLSIAASSARFSGKARGASALRSAGAGGFVFGAAARGGLTSGQASHIAYEARRAQKAESGGARGKRARALERQKLKGTRKWVLDKKAAQRSRAGGGGGDAVRRDTKYTGRKRGPRF